ncbi:ribosome modulation factor [Methylobacterium organophilum]|uniref:Ribosome modulation factor n=1 Tax=Methylobacterium organophilum TaxID=410 RepID=A0ABQ4TAJ8_METOR|nr:Rmf/CrpP family protein [Methylobacterium organophilum]UMY18224.1 hypothetical protein MMB17_02420 [Methylobacterium organophilum]GJE28034.1 hypothetical protein LKMONMHP_2898 [Methylobacterium organophilum]
MSDSTPRPPPRDAIAEGARARAQGRRKDACPYPADSPERRAWMEGFDGKPADQAPDPPLDRG